jgi:hypothetical protein
MFDGGRIVGGAVVLLVAALGPAWFASVRTSSRGAPPQAAKRGPCVEPRADMLRRHPQILAEWRQQAVRGGVREHTVSEGRMVHGSLTGTCLGCHGSAEGFCNRCHTTVGVSLNCWSCHKDAPVQAPFFVGDSRFAELVR